MQSKCKNATEIKIELCVRIKQLNVENSLALNDNLPFIFNAIYGGFFYCSFACCIRWWICQNNRLIGGIVRIRSEMCEKMLHGMKWDWIYGNPNDRINLSIPVTKNNLSTKNFFTAAFFIHLFNSIFIIERLLMNSNRLLIIILFLQQTNNHKRSISISIPCVVCIIISYTMAFCWYNVRVRRPEETWNR